MEDRFKVEIKGIDECLYALSEEGARVVHVRTMNKLSSLGASAARKKVKQLFNLRQDDLSKIVAVKADPKWGSDRVDAAVRATGKPLPLDHFKWGRSGSGAWASIRKDRTAVLPYARVLRMKNGKIGLFKDKEPIEKSPTTGRNKIKKIFTMSTADIVDGETIRNEVQACIDDKAQEIFNHEFDYYIRGATRR